MELPQLKRIYLEDYWHKTEPVYDLLRLIACPQEETLNLAHELVRKRDKLDREAIEFIETVLVYKLPKLSREDIRAMLALTDVKLKDTLFYQEIAEEERQVGMREGMLIGMRDGLHEGMLKGKMEGKLEGKLEGERLLLIKLLNKRFGALPEWVNEKLQQADANQLEAWSERLLDVEALQAVFES